jgi:hypothetical protein
MNNENLQEKGQEKDENMVVLALPFKILFICFSLRECESKGGREREDGNQQG